MDGKPKTDPVEAAEVTGQVIGMILLAVGIVLIWGWAWAAIVGGAFLLATPEVRRFASRKADDDRPAE